jgi:hypothetical protein
VVAEVCGDVKPIEALQRMIPEYSRQFLQSCLLSHAASYSMAMKILRQYKRYSIHLSFAIDERFGYLPLDHDFAVLTIVCASWGNDDEGLLS